MKYNKIILSAFALMVFSLSALVGCEDDSATESQLTPNYVSLANSFTTLEVNLGETGTTQGKVYASQAVGSDRVVDLKVIYEEDTNVLPWTTIDEADITVPASVTIPAGATEASFPITITNTNLGYTGKQLVIAIVPKVGLDVAMSFATYNDGPVQVIEPISKRTVFNAKRACTDNTVNISIVTDAFGSETTWELYNSDFSQVLASGGPYTDGAVGFTDASSLCLPDGDYYFYIYDSYGDGLGTGGSYTLSTRGADGTLTVIETGGGNFGPFAEVAFSLP